MGPAQLAPEKISLGWDEIITALEKAQRRCAIALPQKIAVATQQADFSYTQEGPSSRKEANRLIQYVAERQAMIRYPEFRRRGWQIGSGPTEAECKTTTHRVKGRGRRWDGGNAEAMMALACLDDSRMWQTFWTTLTPARN